MIDQKLVDRVAHAIKTNHELGNDWGIIARNAISEVAYHVLGRQPWPALTEAGEQSRREFESSTS